MVIISVKGIEVGRDVSELEVWNSKRWILLNT